MRPRGSQELILVLLAVSITVSDVGLYDGDEITGSLPSCQEQEHTSSNHVEAVPCLGREVDYL